MISKSTKTKNTKRTSAVYILAILVIATTLLSQVSFALETNGRLSNDDVNEFSGTEVQIANIGEVGASTPSLNASETFDTVNYDENLLTKETLDIENVEISQPIFSWGEFARKTGGGMLVGGIAGGVGMGAATGGAAFLPGAVGGAIAGGIGGGGGYLWDYFTT